jgi:hypothetical protein
MKNLYIFIGLTMLVILIGLSSEHVIDDVDITDKIIDEKVFNYSNDTIYDDYTFNDYYLLFDDYNLSTNNFINTFSFFKNKKYEYKVIEIVPYVNPNYIDLFRNKKFLYYSDDLNYILYKFSNDYLKIYEDNNEDINIREINIQTVRVNTANKYIKDFLSEYNKIKYKTKEGNKYRTL